MMKKIKVIQVIRSKGLFYILRFAEMLAEMSTFLPLKLLLKCPVNPLKVLSAGQNFPLKCPLPFKLKLFNLTYSLFISL